VLSLPDVLTAPAEAVVPMLSGLDGPARDDLARQVGAAFSADIDRRVHGRGDGPVLTDQDRARLKLCRIATAPPPESASGLPRTDDELRVAIARGRRHVQAAAEHAVRMMGWTDGLGWAFRAVRELERRGEVSLPADDDYVHAVIGSFILSPTWESGETLTAGRWTLTIGTADRLRADRDLFDRVFWRFFEVDREQGVSLAGTDRHLPRQATWQQAVLDLIDTGDIDRERVLDATLGALGWATSAYRAGWFVGLHRELAPSPAETAARRPAYDALLRSPIGQVVTVGLDAFRAMRAAGTPIEAPSLADAVLFPGKAVALKALRLGGAPLAQTASDHPHPDVRAAAARLLGHAAPAARMPVTVTPPKTLPPLVRTEPITTRAELAESWAVLVENPSDADLAERVLCATARLGPDPERLRAVLHRATRRIRDAWTESEVLAAQGIVLSVAAGPHRSPPRPRVRFAPKTGLLAARALEIASSLASGVTFRPLAEPTHAGGWIDPAVLVSRLATGALAVSSETGSVERPADAVAALLRLGPDPAAHGPGMAADVPGVFGAALRYALGGPPPATVGPGDAPLWIAAARARAPYDDDAALIALGLTEVGAGRAPVFAPRLLTDGGIGFLAPPPSHPAESTGTGPHHAGAAGEAVHVTGPGRPVDRALLPTVALGTIDDHHDQSLASAWWPWLATTWPGHVGVPAALTLVAWPYSEAGRIAGANVLRPMLDARHEPPPIARVLVAAVLGAEQRVDRVAGADAVLELVPRRLAPADLGEAMAWLSSAVPLQRWAAALRSVAEAGRGPDVAVILGSLLPSLEHSRAGLFNLVELLADIGLPVSDGELRTWLAGFSGTGKAAKAARVALTRRP
jgi:hypothetical protein